MSGASSALDYSSMAAARTAVGRKGRKVETPGNRMIINVTYGNAEGMGPYIQGPAKEHGRTIPGTEDRARIIESNFGFPIYTQDDVDLARDVMRRDLELQHSNTKRITNTGIHSSMSWPPGYEPTRDEMRQAVDGLAKAWDMEGARRISWSHSDTEHRHIHTLWGAVNPDTGRAYHDHERNDRAQREAIRQEREHGPLPASRQRDHDKAAAAEASDHARTMELSRNTDGSILRRSLDRALSLGGHFGPAKTAQRNAFIKQNDLTKFPQHSEQAYAPQEVAREKRDYISKNRESSSSLARAYNREAKERARGVAGLYEDHSFEKTSKPPTQEERERDMGRINDALDWPWKKIGVNKITDKWQDWLDERRYRGTEVQRHNGTTVYPDWFNKREIERYKDYEKRSAARNRDFGKEVEEKGWDDPGVKRQWEKKYGPTREEKREPSWGKPSPHPTQEKDQMPKKTDAEKAAEAEEARIKNWQTQRERREKEEGRIPKSELPWRKDERRTEQWRQQKEQERDEANSVPMPKLNPGKDQIYRPQQSREPPALPRPQEIPMPKIKPPEHALQTQERPTAPPLTPETPQQEPKQPQPQGLPREWWKAARELEDIARGNLARARDQSKPQEQSQPQQEPKPMPYWKDISGQTPSQDFETQVKQATEGKQQEPKPMPEYPDISDIPRARRLANDISNTGPGAALPPVDRERQSQEWDETLDKREEGLRKSWPAPEQGGNKDTRTREEPSSWNPAGRIYEKLDQLDPPTPAQARGDLNASYAPQNFRDQLNESLKKIKPPAQEIGKDRERER